LTISDAEQLAQLSELGVAFLLFMIGLELSWDRLRAMRRLVFGLGMSQIALCSAVLATVFMLMGQPLASAAVLGLGLSLSSTAVVLPVMAERGRMKGAAGRATFATLLAQDLAVAPILVSVTVLAAIAAGGGEMNATAIGRALLTLAPAALAVALLVIGGRVLLRPLFRSVAKSRAKGGGGRQELFVALCLLIIVGAGVAAEAAGLSMSLGALIAGLLLAETEYRREIEVNIEPFKGLLLGVFFVGVGIGLDLDAVAANPVGVFGIALLLTAIKAGLIFGLARLWGVPLRGAIETALLLGPAGEFAFVILNTGLVEGVADPGFTQAVLVSATISIFTIPLMALVAERLLKAAPPEPVAAPLAPSPQSGDVLIVGFGRVGHLVAEMLSEHGQRFIAVDSDVSTVAAARREGAKGFIGNANDATAHWFGAGKGRGTMPHALIGYAGSTVRAAEMFHATFPDADLTVLTDYFGREVTDGLEVCRRFPELAAAGRMAVRLDTHGGRFLEGLDPAESYAVLERHAPNAVRRYRSETELRHLVGTGVSAAAIWRVREALDEAGFPKVRIVASSGFGVGKCRVMAEAKAPIDVVGTGSFIPDAWSETYATADIVEYDGQKRVKVGREFLLRSVPRRKGGGAG
jgi:Kef-type K+ transport system membrane component KefB